MEKIIERIAKVSLGAKLGVVFGALVLVTALNYFVFSLPFGASITDVEAKIKKSRADQVKLDAEYSEKTAIANNLNQFRREKEMLEQKLAEALSELPEEKDIDGLLQLFQDRAQKAGLEIATIEPQAQANEQFYARIPIPMSVVGNFHEIATFLDAIGRLRRIVNVSDIVLDKATEVNGKLVVNGKFLATTFMFVAPTDDKAGKKGASK